MNVGRTLCLGLAAISLLLSSARALAQLDDAPAADANAEAKEQAKVHFERGLSLYRDGAYGAALAEFVRSRTLFPTRAAAQNAALSLRKLERFDEALDELEAVVRDYPSLNEEAKQALSREIAEMSERVGALEVTSSEHGALVYVDGRDRGKTPLSQPLRVAAGSHHVRVYKEGFLPFEARVEVAGKETSSLKATLGALTQAGRLAVVEDHGESMLVVVDGVAVGTTPWEGTLPIGVHVVTLQGEGNIGSAPASVVIHQHRLSKLSLVAQPLPCSLHVEPSPLGARVAINGVDVGHGSWRGALPCGAHVVEIAQEGFLPVSRNVALVEGKDGIVAETLERDPNSELWRAENPSRIMLDIHGGLLVAPSLGGDLAGGCKGDCSKDLALGVRVVARGGYRFGSGVGLSMDVGYLAIGQTYDGRTTSIFPTGLTAHSGVARDRVRISGATLGASFVFERGSKLVWMGRLGAGALLGQWSDERSGEFATSAGVPYAASTLREEGGLQALYIDPEARIGYRIGTRWIVDIGLQATILMTLSDTEWTDRQEISAGRCPSPNVDECAGRGGYGTSQVLGGVLALPSVVAGARYEF